MHDCVATFVTIVKPSSKEWEWANTHHIYRRPLTDKLWWRWICTYSLENKNEETSQNVRENRFLKQKIDVYSFVGEHKIKWVSDYEHSILFYYENTEIVSNKMSLLKSSTFSRGSISVSKVMYFFSRIAVLCMKAVWWRWRWLFGSYTVNLNNT